MSFETGHLAQQSQGAVVAQLGDTVVLATANAPPASAEGIDFFPLTVDVEERMYAAGKIPGSFFRREGRPSDTAILTARLIDRPLRPSFAEGYRNETQVVITVLGADQENPHDVLAINAASAALMLSGTAVRRTHRRGAPGVQQRREVGAAPDLPGGRRVGLRAGGSRAAARGRRRGHHDGRGRRHRVGVGLVPVRGAEGHRGSHRRRPGIRQDMDPGERRAPTAAGGRSRQPPASPVRPSGGLRARRGRAGRPGRHPTGR